MDLFQVLHQMRKYDAGVDTSSDETTQYSWPSHQNRSTLAKFSTFHKLAVPDDADFRDLHGRFGDSAGSLDRNQRISLTDQFTWGSVVSAGIFIIVFVCVMSAWWVQKKRRSNSTQRLENCPQGAAEEGSAQQQKPPSYFEVVSVQDLPPSYSEAIIICRRCNSTSTIQGFDNLAAVLEEGAPERSKVLEMAASNNHQDDDCIVITVPEHDCCRQSNS